MDRVLVGCGVGVQVCVGVGEPLNVVEGESDIDSD